MHLKMSSAKWRPFCLGLNVLIIHIYSLDRMQTRFCTILFWKYVGIITVPCMLNCFEGNHGIYCMEYREWSSSWFKYSRNLRNINILNHPTKIAQHINLRSTINTSNYLALTVGYNPVQLSRGLCKGKIKYVFLSIIRHCLSYRTLLHI